MGSKRHTNGHELEKEESWRGKTTREDPSSHLKSRFRKKKGPPSFKKKKGGRRGRAKTGILLLGRGTGKRRVRKAAVVLSKWALRSYVLPFNRGGGGSM